jgi:hypothetical protein
LQALRSLGVAPELVAQAQAVIAERNAKAAFGVWPEHWHAVQALLAMATQWRVVAGMGGVMWVGLDYGPLRDELRCLRRSIPRQCRQPEAEVRSQLKVLEAAALNVFNPGR